MTTTLLLPESHQFHFPYTYIGETVEMVISDDHFSPVSASSENGMSGTVEVPVISNFYPSVSRQNCTAETMKLVRMERWISSVSRGLKNREE